MTDQPRPPQPDDAGEPVVPLGADGPPSPVAPGPIVPAPEAPASAAGPPGSAGPPPVHEPTVPQPTVPAPGSYPPWEPPDGPPPAPPEQQPYPTPTWGETPPGQPYVPPAYGPPSSGQAPYGQTGYGQTPSGQFPSGRPPAPFDPAFPPGAWDAYPMTSEERTWAPAAHWLPLVTGWAVGIGWIGPLVLMLTVGQRSPRVLAAAKESLNFEITVAIAVVVSVVLMFALIGFILLPIVGVGAFVLHIMAAVSESKGQPYRYPFTLRLIS